jgi:hypothetical protein
LSEMNPRNRGVVDPAHVRPVLRVWNPAPHSVPVPANAVTLSLRRISTVLRQAKLRSIRCAQDDGLCDEVGGRFVGSRLGS